MKRHLAVVMAFTIAVVMAFSGMAYAGDAAAGKKLFKGKGKCKTCHKLTAKKAVGPGLKGVMGRHSREWLVKWLADPQGTWEENDAETQQLKKWKKGRDKKKKTSMKTKKLTPEQIEDLLAYLEANT